MPNQRDWIFVLHEQGMRNCDIARKLGVAPPNVRRAIKRLQELGHIGDRPRSGRKTRPTKFDSVYANKCPWNRYLERIGELKSQTRASTQAVQAPKGSTSDGSEEACTTGKMSIPSSSLSSSKLGANSVYGCKAIHHRTSPQSSNDRNLYAEAPGMSAISEHRQNRRSVMVWAGICATWRPHWFASMREYKLAKTFTDMEVPRAGRHFVRQHWNFNKIPLQPTERKRRSNAARDFPDFITSRNGASLLNGSEPCRLQHLVNFGSKDTC